MKSILISSLLLSCATTAIGQEWSYEDCVNYAREHNISLQKSILTEESAAYDLENAQAQWYPTLDFATNHGFTNYPWSNGNKNSYSSNYGLNAGWKVWDGGQRENTIKRNKLQTEISQINTSDIMRTLETDLLQIYLNILYAKESIAIYEEAVNLSKKQAERAEQLMLAGKLSRVDYAQLASQYEQDKYALVNSQSTYETRRMELKKLLELGIENNIELKNLIWDEAEIMVELPEIEDSYRLAVSNDLQIKSLQLEKESSDIDVKIAKASSRPQISLNAGLGTAYYAPGTNFTSGLKQGWNETIGLSLSLPILDNKKTKTAVAKAKVQSLSANLDINKRYTDLAQCVENWYIDTKSSQSKFSAAREQLKAAELSNELTNEQFNLGLVNTIELLTAHNNLVEARHTLLQSKYMTMLGIKMIEFYRTATISLP